MAMVKRGSFKEQQVNKGWSFKDKLNGSPKSAGQEEDEDKEKKEK